jgi:hypothetical protein
MVNLIDFFRKVKSIDIIYDPCCNNCLNGKVKYLGEITEVTQGIDCIFDKKIRERISYNFKFSFFD